MAADTYTIVSEGLFYHLKNDRTGFHDIEYIDCKAEAENYKEEYEYEAAKAEAEELAAAQAAAKDELIDHVQDFLRALDRGHLGDVLRFDDGTESAYVVALRTAVAPFERRA